MPKPVAPAQGVAFAFPDVCLTPAPPAPPIPVPYPNIAQLDQALGISNLPGKALLVGPASLPLLLKDSSAPVSSGDEPGAVGGVTSGTIKGECKVTQASTSVVYGPSSLGIARFLDQTSQNNNNAQGMLLSAFPTVMAGD